MSLYFVVIVVLYRFCGVNVSLNVAPCFWSLPVLDVYILSGLSGMGCLIDISWNTGNGPFKWFLLFWWFLLEPHLFLFLSFPLCALILMAARKLVVWL